MSDQKKYRPEMKAGIWPVIDSPEAARWAVKQAFWASMFCATVTAGFAVWAHLSSDFAGQSGFNLFALVDASIFVVIGFGIYRNSRTAAIIGLAFYLLEKVAMLTNTAPGAFMVIIVITLCYISGIRGAFAFHKLTAQEASREDAPIEP